MFSVGIILNAGSLKARFWTSSLLILIVISSIRCTEAATPNLGDDDVAGLKRGEILLETIHMEKSGGAARVTALFYTNTSVIWNIIGYCKYEVIYMRGLQLCEVLEGDQFHMTMHHRIRNSWYTPTLDFTFEARREPGGHGQAHLVDGDLKVLEGHWKFFPLADDNAVIVVHEIRIQPRFPAPKWLVRRSLRKDLPDMLACIRGLAGASRDVSHIKADLKRCPGEIPEVSK